MVVKCLLLDKAFKSSVVYKMVYISPVLMELKLACSGKQMPVLCVGGRMPDTDGVRGHLLSDNNRANSYRSSLRDQYPTL